MSTPQFVWEKRSQFVHVSGHTCKREVHAEVLARCFKDFELGLSEHSAINLQDLTVTLPKQVLIIPFKHWNQTTVSCIAYADMEHLCKKQHLLKSFSESWLLQHQ